MGEVRATLFQPEFHRSLRVEAGAERLTADAGALLVCELTSGRRVLVVIDAALSPNSWDTQREAVRVCSRRNSAGDFIPSAECGATSL